MGDGKITTETVALGVAETAPIVLRETDTRRLVFQPMIVEKPEAPVRGVFVWQRKLKADEWEDITGESLNSLKAGEGFKLVLKSDEVAALLQGIQDRKAIYEKHGIEFGERDYLAEADLPDVVRRMLAEPELAEALRSLDSDALLSLDRSVEVSKLDSLLAEWDENKDNDDEGFWQDLLKRNAWVFSQLTGSPVVLLEERAYVGGKGISNVGGNYVDYLVTNSLTDNVSLIEIKTPGAALCRGSAYRSDSGIHAPGKDVAGGVVQVLSQRDKFLGNLNTLRAESGTEFHAYNPRCYLVVGQIESLPDEETKRSFELFRNGQADVQILTFDEARARLGGIRDVLTATDDSDEGASSVPAESRPTG
jgi:Shedu protein SduA, N-terminal/Shedu protein SduA, C-terminal